MLEIQHNKTFFLRKKSFTPRLFFFLLYYNKMRKRDLDPEQGLTRVYVVLVAAGSAISVQQRICLLLAAVEMDVSAGATAPCTVQ